MKTVLDAIVTVADVAPVAGAQLPTWPELTSSAPIGRSPVVWIH